MIQRIQSIWLSLAAACAFAGFKLSFYSGNKLNDTAIHELNATSTTSLMVTTIAVATLALLTIFLFKKRKIQFNLCIQGIILEVVLIFIYYSETTIFTQGNYSLTAILHGIILIAFVLAARAINKDSKMVKDSDRLR